MFEPLSKVSSCKASKHFTLFFAKLKISGSRKLATISNHDGLVGPAGGGPDLLDGLDHIHSLHHPPEHHVLPVEPLCLHGAYEELGPVRPRPRVGHGQDPRPCVLLYEVLICELRPVYRLASGPIPSREIASLTWKK